MTWNLTQSTDQFNWWKLEQTETAEVKYNKESHSFRIMANDKRLFFVDKRGLFQNRFLIRTEYGVIAAEVLPKKTNSGILIFEDKKYNYEWSENLIVVSRSKERFQLSIDINTCAISEPIQLYALLFSTLRVFICQPALA